MLMIRRIVVRTISIAAPLLAELEFTSAQNTLGRPYEIST